MSVGFYRRHREDREAAEAEQPAPDPSPYADLTDEQLVDAYLTNVVGDEDPESLPESRDEFIAALEALDAE
ncbi:hypothetical protein ACJ5H2_13555 [Nocardioides sp. R1-1]|uniref:hypothetical protein n=1 Tax=Nocardioides sp. R1-1 TaxID=3383502 RepID=UPI0038D0B813